MNLGSNLSTVTFAGRERTGLYLPLHGAMTPSQVSPTTVRKTTPAARVAETKKKTLNSDLVKKFCKYLSAATA